MMDEHKICFIICSNNGYYLEECLFYISKLEVPSGCSIDVISISDAESMTSGYNEGMRATDAKYKVYLHQDVFIIYKGFLQAVLDIFQSDSAIGMIGMVGAPRMPVGGVMWYGAREGALYGSNKVIGEYAAYQYHLADGLHEVEAVDGLMMITAADIAWREDKFDGWDFYDVSQSFEFRRQGYKVVVPEQLCPWCVHDDGIVNLVNYDKYRRICMEEYPEYFYPERFLVGRRSEGKGSATQLSAAKGREELYERKLRAVIIARNQFEETKTLLESLKAFAGLDERDIIIVDNGSEDGLRHWLRGQQEIDYIICGDLIESYAGILNEAVKQFIKEEDLLLLSPGLMALPDCMEALYDVLQESAQIGAVCARTIPADSAEGKSYNDAAAYAMAQAGDRGRRELLGLPHEAVLIRNEILRQTGGFDSRLILPDSTMVDFAFQGIKLNYRYYEVQNAFFYKISESEKIYYEKFGRDVDRRILKQKWEMNYFNDYPNYRLLSFVDKGKEEKFSVLEIGCDCGVNLLHLKNQYPGVQLYGVEINASAVEIASHVAQVQVANIEDKSLDFAGTRFDYIIFGDVLEHLRDPEGTIQYCKSLLKTEGRILACIPNLMHYSVMRGLLNGDFTYADMGLLDRTHIHFFTFNEMVRMFARSGYEIDRMIYTGDVENASEEDKEFVNKLLSISGKAREFMFYVFQYIVSAKKDNNEKGEE